MFQLPTEMLQSLINNICASQNANVLIVTSLAVFALPEPRQHDLRISLSGLSSNSIRLLREWLPRVGPGLHSLSAEIDDEFLLLLSSSPSSRSIKELYLSLSTITDASEAAWSHFSALEELNIWLCSFIGFETLRSVSMIPNLRFLQSGLEPPIAIEQLEELLGTDRLQKLEQFRLNLGHMFHDEDAKKRLFTLLSKRPNLNRLTLDLSDPHIDDVIAVHKLLPHLTHFVSIPNATDDFMRLLPYGGNVRWLSMFELGRFSKAQFAQIAASLPLLETLLIDLEDGNGPDSIGNDLSIFPCLRELQLSCTNIHKINKFPQTLVDVELCEAGGSEEETTVAESDIKLFMDEICKLTNLEFLKLECHAPLITAASFSALSSSLTRMQTLSLVQREPAAPEEVRLPLTTMPHLSQPWINVPNLELDPARLYLPALRSTEYCSRIPWSSTREQLPNLSYVNVSDMTDVEKQSIDETFFDRFGSQLRGLVDPPADLRLSQLLTFSNLYSLQIDRAISCSDAAAMLQSLHKLEQFKAILDVISPDFNWLKHSNLSRLTLSLNAESVEPHLDFTPAQTPILTSLTLSFKGCKRARVRISNLKYLEGASVQKSLEPGETGMAIALEISDATFLSSLYFSSLEFESLKIVTVPFLKEIQLSAGSLPADDSGVQLEAPRLRKVHSWDDGMEEMCGRLELLNMK
jgi:hypothetical protein